jgi:hypothetical protein
MSWSWHEVVWKAKIIFRKQTLQEDNRQLPLPFPPRPPIATKWQHENGHSFPVPQGIPRAPLISLWGFTSLDLLHPTTKQALSAAPEWSHLQAQYIIIIRLAEVWR